MEQNLVLNQIESMIYVVRGQKVMLDSDLAELYDVEVKRLNEQVKRNLDRFPNDFMFTENGVAMLSSVPNSPKSIQVNIAIMRIFTKLRSFLLLESQINDRMDRFEENTNRLFKIVFERLDSIEDDITPYLPKERSKIGLKDKK